MRYSLLALVVAAALTGCGGGEDATDTTVTVRTFQFTPKEATVEAGATVRFENTDGTVHDVTLGTRDAPTAGSTKKLGPKTGSAEFVVTQSTPYFCSLHSGPGMEGQILVASGG